MGVAQAALLMVMPFLSAEGQFDQQAASNLRTSMRPAGIELEWQATATEVDTVSGREIAGERRVQGQRTSRTFVADTGSIEPSDTDDSVPEVGNYYVYQVRALRDSATRAWSNQAIIDPAARSFGAAGSDANHDNHDNPRSQPTLIGPSTVDYPENSTVPVATYSASEPDVGDFDVGAINWSLDGTDLVFFSLTDGELSFKQPPNYENPADGDADNDYEVTVVAADSQDECASIIVTVTVTDVDDPNVVLIMADDAGVELFGAYGSTQYRTPRLDALAAIGARFSHAYANASCTPSRVALMTGRYGVRNYVNFRHLSPTEYTFTDMFNAAGYETAIAGKWHLDGDAERFAPPRPQIPEGAGGDRAVAPRQQDQLGVSPAESGFDSYCLTITNATGGRKYWRPSIDCNGQITERGQQDYGPDIFTDFIVSFIESNQNRRFFAYYSMALPHSPFIRPPAPIAQCRDGNDDQCNFEDMVAYLDHNVGRIYDKLSDLDLLDNTVLIFTADNGTTPYMISHLNGQAIAGDKGRPTPGGTHVPLIVLAPGGGARVIDDLIDFTDFLPTLAEVVGFQVPEHVSVDGVSFGDRFEGRAGQPREWIYTYLFPYPYESDRGHPLVAYVRDKRYQLFEDGAFFDVEADPHLINPLPTDDENSREAKERLEGVLSQFDSDGDAILWDLVPSRPDSNKYPLWRPVLRSAVVDGNVLTLTYAGTIDTAAVPTAASYAAQVDGTERAVVNVEFSTSTVALTLASAVTSSQSVTASYTPGRKALRHVMVEHFGGQLAIPLSHEAVSNESPPNARPLFVWDATGDREVAEGTAAGSAFGAPFAAGDADGDSLTYAVSGDDSQHFELDTLSGELRTKATLNYESKRRYAFTVSVRDGKDAQDQADEELDDELAVRVTVTNIEESPVVTGPTSIEFAENRSGTVAAYQASDPDGDAVTWRPLAGADREHFMFSNGTLSFEQPADYEARADDDQDNTYELRLRAFDGSLTGKHTVTVTVTNVDEEGSLSLSSEQPQVGTPLTATLTDPDQLEVVQSWAWERSANLSSWTSIAAATSGSYVPTADTMGQYLRVTANYHDGHGTGKVLQTTSDRAVAAMPITNTAPYFPSIKLERSVAENSSRATHVGLPVIATDANDDPLSYRLSGPDVDQFHIDARTGQITVADGAALDHESDRSLSVTVSARDPSDAEDSTSVEITVNDLNERPTATDDIAATVEDESLVINVLGNDSDPDNDNLTVTHVSPPGDGTATIEPGQTVRYTPNQNFNGQDSFSYTASDDEYGASATVIVNIRAVNDAPLFPHGPIIREVARTASEGDHVGAPIVAGDVDDDILSYQLSASEFEIFEIFEINADSGQITVAPSVTFDPSLTESYEVSVEAADNQGGLATVDVTINVTERVSPPSTAGGGGGGGGGPPPVPIPSNADFDWNVTRDIEALHRDNDIPTGIWSDGRTLWVLEHAASGADSVFAYGLQNGQREPQREIELDRRNRFSHGIWSDGETVWVADSGQDQLFAYIWESGERSEAREFKLAERHRDPRGIWSDGEVMYVLDSVKDALFVYDLDSGDFLLEHPLDKLNHSPRGIWSDGFTLWVSDDGAKRLFAYEFEDGALMRKEDLEFTFRSLLKAGNGDARGIWSDGDTMYVVDEQDDKVYTYNIPDAIIAQLASLSLGDIDSDTDSDIDIGEFSTNRLDYTAIAAQGVSATTVAVEALHEAATVEIEPGDADGDHTNGHQIILEAESTITIAVTSEDGSRTTNYQVQVSKPPCLEGLSEERLSEVSFVGGSVSDLAACARSLDVDALYHQLDGVWTARFLFPDLPEFLSRPFHNRFATGLLPGEGLIAKRQRVPIPAPGTPSSK